MKIALFISKNQTYIQYQIIRFIKNLKFIGLDNEQVIIIEKPEKLADGIEYDRMSNFARKLSIGIKENIFIKIQKIIFSKIASFQYKKLDIKKFSIKYTNSDETKKILRENAVDIAIFIYYDKIVKKEILDIPKLCLNVHGASLPDFRGHKTLFWQLVYNQPFYVLTLHKMDEGIDTGDIIFELPFKTKPNRSLFYLYVKSTEKIYLLLLMGLRRILLFDLNFGISQEKYKGEKRYFSCSVLKDIDNLAKSIPKQKIDNNALQNIKDKCVT